MKREPKILSEELEIYAKDLEERKMEICRDVVLNAIYHLRLPQPIKQCCKKINLKDFPNWSESLMGQIIGKEGKHKQDFFEITGVNLELDTDNTDVIILSKYHTVEVEKAKKLLNKLCGGKQWDHKHIKKQWDKINKEFKDNCVSEGSKYLKDYLEYEVFSENLAEMVGLLAHKFSFSQNMLDHSLEVAQISSNIAVQIGLNKIKAKRAGFFHDIGKSIANYDDHVIIGLEIAEKEQLEDYICNTIESHHNKVPTNNPYAVIVKSVDKISAGRIGARPMQNAIILERKAKITNSLSKLSWIDKTVLKNAGNLIQVFLKAKEFDHAKLPEMKEELKATLSALTEHYVFNYQMEFKLFYEDKFWMKDVPTSVDDGLPEDGIVRNLNPGEPTEKPAQPVVENTASKSQQNKKRWQNNRNKQKNRQEPRLNDLSDNKPYEKGIRGQSIELGTRTEQTVQTTSVVVATATNKQTTEEPQAEGKGSKELRPQNEKRGRRKWKSKKPQTTNEQKVVNETTNQPTSATKGAEPGVSQEQKATKKPKLTNKPQPQSQDKDKPKTAADPEKGHAKKTKTYRGKPKTTTTKTEGTVPV